MFDIIKNVITAGGYDLEKLLYKIDVYHLEDKLTDEQRTELVAMARAQADPHSSYGQWQDVIDGLAERLRKTDETVAALAERVAALESGNVNPPDPPPEQPQLNSNGTEWWSEYVPPTGAHNMYNKGDKITFKGERYISKENGNVWSPFAYPAYWEKQH